MVSSSLAIADAIRILAKEDIIATYLHTSSVALFVFDFLLTLGREVELIWVQPRTVVTILFFINRYFPFLDSVALISPNFSSSTITRAVGFCGIGYKIQFVCYIIGICASEGILITRTAAVWGNSKRVFWMLVVLLGLGAAAAVFLTAKYGSLAPDEASDPVIKYLSCPSRMVTGENSIYLAGPWIITLVSETILICLTLPKALSYRVLGRTDLYDAVYVVGSWFYVYTLATSVANIIVILYPFNHLEVHPLYLIISDRIVHSILASRLVLSIRGAAAGRRTQTSTAISAMEFYVPGRDGDHLDFGVPQSRPAAFHT